MTGISQHGTQSLLATASPLCKRLMLWGRLSGFLPMSCFLIPNPVLSTMLPLGLGAGCCLSGHARRRGALFDSAPSWGVFTSGVGMVSKLGAYSGTFWAMLSAVMMASSSTHAMWVNETDLVEGGILRLTRRLVGRVRVRCTRAGRVFSICQALLAILVLMSRFLRNIFLMMIWMAANHRKTVFFSTVGHSPLPLIAISLCLRRES